MESSIEKRLDDFATQVDARFDAVDQRIDKFEYKTELRFAAIDERFDRVDERLGSVDKRLDKIDDRFDVLRRTMLGFQQTMVRIGGGMFIALVGLIATQL